MFQWLVNLMPTKLPRDSRGGFAPPEPWPAPPQVVNNGDKRLVFVGYQPKDSLTGEPPNGGSGLNLPTTDRGIRNHCPNCNHVW